MNALTEQVTTPLKLALGRLSYRVDFSVMELLCILLVVLGAVWLAALICALVRGRTWRVVYPYVLGAVSFGLTVYVGFCFLWGVNYYTDSFQERSGIYAQPVAAEDLKQVTALFAEKVNATAGEVPRDEQGRFAVPRQEILSNSVRVYDAVEEQFPFLALDDPGVKAVHFSRIMSALDFTGIYCPYTGESNVNMDSPACMLPSTVAHELAHQRAISSEQECNFLAVLASTTCDDPAYRYSGWLMGFIYLSNALFRADREAWQAIRESLDPGAVADMQSNNDYWAQFDGGAVQKVSNKVYDGFLKSYGDENGIQSYGTVVDLLVAYYRAG